MNKKSLNVLIEDVKLAFKLFEFSIRLMCYAELEKINIEDFDQEINLNLEKGNKAFSSGNFRTCADIIKTSQMAVGTTFGSTAICLDSLLKQCSVEDGNTTKAKKLIKAVRNAFAHNIAAPCWYIKQHNREILDMSFIKGPVVDLGELNGKIFDYAQIGGLDFWYSLKEFIFKEIKSL